MSDIRSRPRIPQKRVQVSKPVFSPAGAEEQRLYTEGEPTPPTTEADIQKRLGTEMDKSTSDNAERFKRIQGMYAPQTPKEDQPPEVEALDKEIEETPTAVEGEKPPGSFEESPEEVKAKFKVQLRQAIEKGDIDPHEIQETIKRLSR